MAQQLRALAFSEDPSSVPYVRQAAGNSLYFQGDLLPPSSGLCWHLYTSQTHTPSFKNSFLKKINYVAHEGLGNGLADKSICLAGRRFLV